MSVIQLKRQNITKIFDLFLFLKTTVILDYTAREDRLEGLQLQHRGLIVRSREAAPAKNSCFPTSCLFPYTAQCPQVLMSLETL